MRAARTTVLLLALLLLTQPLLALAPAAASGGGTRSGGELEVTDGHVVTGREEWDAVIVGRYATLRVLSGGLLLTSALSLGEGSQLEVIGGTMVIGAMDWSGIEYTGTPGVVEITQGGTLMVEGVAGNATIGWGWACPVMIMASESILVEDSQVVVTGGDGHSPTAPVTVGDLTGNRFAGGPAVLSLRVEEGGSGVSIIRSTLVVEGGDGGAAPDGRAPVGGNGGAAGGYTAGGNVSGGTGAGGDASLILEGPRVELESSSVLVLGGRGGDAGDGGPGGATGGGGGGGYSGGAGDPGEAGDGGPAGRGGTVTGHVGTGGDALARISTARHVQEASSFTVMGGDGGDAGNGGRCDAVDPVDVLGGGGGGGYSGGGGGGAGEAWGTDGGDGGQVGGHVGSGGTAQLTVVANVSTCTGGTVEVVAGHGGRGGAAGTSTGTVDDWRAGGGGGSYSGGGGAGTSSSTWSSGEGGSAPTPTGTVGSGGDALLDLRVGEATIPADLNLSAKPGPGGACVRADAPGPEGGQGSGLVTRDGYRTEHIPVSRVALLAPDDGEVSSQVPAFTWAPVHFSSSAGAVVTYEFCMDDDPSFGSPDIVMAVNTVALVPPWIHNLTSYWRVRALYERPWKDPGPWSQVRSFTYINLPPVVSEIPVFEVMVSQVTVIDLSPYLSDPDGRQDFLDLDCDHPNVLSMSQLNLSVHFPEELGLVALNVTVTDSLNQVPFQVMLDVTRYRHWPHIVGLTNHKPPLELKVFEGTEAWYDVLVHDVDSEKFTYRTTGSWDGVEAFPNGTLRVRGPRGDVGDHTITLWVADEGGREDSARVYVEVLNVNDPPDPPAIVSPSKRITVRVGDRVSFSAVVSDPDLEYGQVLAVSFVSNDTGVFKTMRTTTVAATDYDLFTVGQHLVTVVVSDGQYSASDQVVVNVEEPPAPSPVSTPGSEGPSMWVYLAASLLLFAVGFTLGHVQNTRRRGPGDLD